VRVRFGVMVMVVAVLASAVATANATVKKFAVKTTVEAERGADGEPTGYLVGKVTSPQPWCVKKASINIGSSPEDVGFGALTETNGKGEWRALPGQLEGRTVVVIVKSPSGYGPKIGKHTTAACKTFRTTVQF
jgi:hypothetical protein